MRRRRRRNPGLFLPLALAAGAVGVGAFFLLRKKEGAFLVAKNGTPFVTTPEFTTGFTPQAAAIAILKGDCFVAVNGQAGFNVDFAPAGENVALKALAASGGAATIAARSIDPRAPADLPDLVVPVAAISGSGDCQ